MSNSEREFRLLFVGDVVGRPGRQALNALLPALREELAVDLAVVNGENSAGGAGITLKTAEEIFRAGADVITTGNHIWNQKGFTEEIEQLDRVIRPANYPPGAPGRGMTVIEIEGFKVVVINLQGRVFLPPLDDPFRVVDALLADHPEANIAICDLHAEATSEKQAMGWHLDGRVSLVAGTHTHVPTADTRILPGGTAYVTDVGMVGPRDGILGVQREAVLFKFRTGMPNRFEPAEGVVTFNSVLVTIDRATGKAMGIERVDREYV